MSEWQTLDDHLKAVAAQAREFATAFGAGEWGEAAGGHHDLGKGQPPWPDYLLASATGRKRLEKVPHAIHGAKLAVERHPALGRILAYVIAGHHGGLPDWSTLEKQLAKERELDEARECRATDAFPAGFPFRDNSGNSQAFILSFFTRMVFSCLVDADWLDTEAFLDPGRAAWRQGYPTIATLAGRFFPRYWAMVANAASTPVNRIRREVVDACLAATDRPPGLFSLTVPTGGGKTLASLAFALKHAERHDLRRIVYVIPYTSIIEQNAQEFRKYLGEDAVVEHHSTFDPGQGRGEDDAFSPELRRSQLACENWDAPVIATTAVQFFESLFASRPGRCRKLHNLAKSVIILDEAQMLPRKYLLPCLAAIRELAARYGATLVLCTATQPAVRQREDFPQGLKDMHEIIPDKTGLHSRLRRVIVEDLGILDDEALAGRLMGHHQALCVVNTRAHARQLFERLRGRDGVYHLSTTMTAVHRSCRIDAIRAALKAGSPCLVISTSLIEAGVDLDFPVVYRAAAGADSVAQAAGRCDREGRLTQAAGEPAGRVYVFTPAQGLPKGDFTITADKAAEAWRQGYDDPLCPEAIEHYFRLLFWTVGKELDAKGILGLLEEGKRGATFPFRTVSEAMEFIEDWKKPIIVAHDDEAKKLVAQLEFSPTPGLILRSLQRYVATISPRDWGALIDAGAAKLVLEGVAVISEPELYQGLYCDDVGLCPERKTVLSSSSLTL
ncbi:MAG: CRISPR-associated helicase Cas3' [Desulfovibrionaceae bacterium]|nr:CRISPR-associated helicase Cas3' [Desulfovibrionaceae bacterium]